MSLLKQYSFGRMLQFISLPLKFEIISNSNAQLIQNSITSYHKNQERTRRKAKKKKKKKKNWSNDWKKKAPKPCKVLQCFFAKLNGSMKLNRSESPRIIFWKSLPDQLLTLKCGRFDVPWKIVVFIIQSRLKLYDFSIVDGLLKRTQNVVVRGLEAADGMWQNNNGSNNYAWA